MEVEDKEPGSHSRGGSMQRVQLPGRNSDAPMSPVEQALLRSQSGPCAGVPFSACPSSPLTRIDSALFRVLLQRRLHLSLPLSKRICGCGRPLDLFGHHRAAYSRDRGFGKEGASLWRVRPPESAGKLGAES